MKLPIIETLHYYDVPTLLLCKKANFEAYYLYVLCDEDKAQYIGKKIEPHLLVRFLKAESDLLTVFRSGAEPYYCGTFTRRGKRSKAVTDRNSLEVKQIKEDVTDAMLPDSGLVLGADWSELAEKVLAENPPKKLLLHISQDYPVHHTRRGEHSRFKDKILSGVKIHTVRGNLKLWQERAELINSKEFVLDLKEWSGTPYDSPQNYITSVEKIRIQPLYFEYNWNEQLQKGEFRYFIDRDGQKCELNIEERKELAANDGLDGIMDLNFWFKDIRGARKYKASKAVMAIVHFTDKWY